MGTGLSLLRLDSSVSSQGSGCASACSWVSVNNSLGFGSSSSSRQPCRGQDLKGNGEAGHQYPLQEANKDTAPVVLVVRPERVANIECKGQQEELHHGPQKSCPFPAELCIHVELQEHHAVQPKRGVSGVDGLDSISEASPAHVFHLHLEGGVDEAQVRVTHHQEAEPQMAGVLGPGPPATDSL